MDNKIKKGPSITEILLDQKLKKEYHIKILKKLEKNPIIKREIK